MLLNNHKRFSRLNQIWRIIRTFATNSKTKMGRLTIMVIVSMLTLTGWAQTSERILGGELSNSAATSVEDIDEVMPRMKAL